MTAEAPTLFRVLDQDEHVGRVVFLHALCVLCV